MANIAKSSEALLQNTFPTAYKLSDVFKATTDQYLNAKVIREDQVVDTQGIIDIVTKDLGAGITDETLLKQVNTYM